MPEDQASVLVRVDVLQALLREVQQLRDEVKALEARQDQEYEQMAGDICNHGQRIATLENKPTEPTEKTTCHIDELYRLMLEEKTQQVSIAKAARLLGLTKERLRQLKPLILADGRFEIGWSNLKGQKGVVIRIRQYLR